MTSQIYMVIFRASRLKSAYQSFKFLKNKHGNNIFAIYRNSKYDRGLHFIESKSIESIRDSLLKPYISKIYPDPIESSEFHKIFNKAVNQNVEYELEDSVKFKIAAVTRSGIIKKFVDSDKKRAVIQLTGNQMLLFELDTSKLSKMRKPKK